MVVSSDAPIAPIPRTRYHRWSPLRDLAIARYIFSIAQFSEHVKRDALNHLLDIFTDPNFDDNPPTFPEVLDHGIPGPHEDPALLFAFKKALAAYEDNMHNWALMYDQKLDDLGRHLVLDLLEVSLFLRLYNETDADIRKGH